ncbi:endochitinase-like [Rhipicephalus microplus]|uniref:endochitinase-like n=1 Tax=Rhipicephalus microplus TaxID=6941 RepID=UPI003F6C9D66
MARQMSNAQDRLSVLTAAAETPNYYTFCFWDGFSRFRSGPYKSSVSDIPAELCSAVVYSHVTIDEASHSIRLTDKELELDSEAKSYANSWLYNPIWLLPPNKVFEQMTKLKKRNPNLKILLAVGGPHDPQEKYWQFIPVVYYWKGMTESLAQWLRTYDFDGVVLDFFSGTTSLQDNVRTWDKAKFIHPFVRQINYDLREHKKMWSITLTLPAFDSTTHHLFDIESLTKEVNFFLVKSSDCLEFPKGALLNVTRTIDMTDIDRAELIVRKGAPRQRIVLEVPLFARTYTAMASATGVHTVFPGISGNYTDLQGFLASYEVCHQLQIGWQKGRSDQDSCPFLRKDEEYVAYEDDKSVLKKANMVMGRKYRGAAVRSVDLDDYNSRCAGKSNLLRGLRSSFDAAKADIDYPYNPPTASWWNGDNDKFVSTTAAPLRQTPTKLPEASTQSKEEGPTGTMTLVTGARQTSFVTLPALQTPPAAESTTETVPSHDRTTASESGKLLKDTATETSMMSSTLVTTEASTTKSSDNICKGAKESAMLPHESDCSKYYHCVHTRPYLQNCAPGTIFDIERQICNWPAITNRPECKLS